jgi:DNA-binding NarL/FixJ family response regulator
MNIMIIDDDDDDTALFCEAVKELFPDANCLSVSSCDGIEDKINNARPDIIFLDGHMYPINGKECLKEINRVIGRGNIKVIIHSGSLSPSESRAFIELGVDDIILKAPSYQELKANIERIIVDKYYLASRL